MGLIDRQYLARTSPRIPRTASLGYRRKGAEPWLLMVASPSGSTADVADLAFARACPGLNRGQAQRHADATVSSHGSAPFRRDPKLAVCGIRGEVRFS
jgi:hypothetical protein